MLLFLRTMFSLAQVVEIVILRCVSALYFEGTIQTLGLTVIYNRHPSPTERCISSWYRLFSPDPMILLYKTHQLLLDIFTSQIVGSLKLSGFICDVHLNPKHMTAFHYFLDGLNKKTMIYLFHSNELNWSWLELRFYIIIFDWYSKTIGVK